MLVYVIECEQCVFALCATMSNSVCVLCSTPRPACDSVGVHDEFTYNYVMQPTRVCKSIRLT